jgi:hypothetical protein
MSVNENLEIIYATRIKFPDEKGIYGKDRAELLNKDIPRLLSIEWLGSLYSDNTRFFLVHQPASIMLYSSDRGIDEKNPGIFTNLDEFIKERPIIVDDYFRIAQAVITKAGGSFESDKPEWNWHLVLSQS